MATTMLNETFTHAAARRDALDKTIRHIDSARQHYMQQILQQFRQRWDRVWTEIAAHRAFEDYVQRTSLDAAVARLATDPAYFGTLRRHWLTARRARQAARQPFDALQTAKIHLSQLLWLALERLKDEWDAYRQADQGFQEELREHYPLLYPLRQGISLH